MCRNIKTLFNFEPPATDAEVHASSLQFVRKLSGTTKPSVVNQPVMDQAVAEIEVIVKKMLAALETKAPPKNREAVAEQARLRNQKRFS